MEAVELPGSRHFESALRVAAATGAALIIGAGAVVSPLMTIAAVFGLAFVVISFSDLGAGVAFFTAITFFDSIPGVPAAGLTAVKAAAGVLVLAWLVHLTKRRGAPSLFRDRPFLAQLLAGFCALAFMSVLWSSDQATAISHALRLSQGVLLIVIVYSALTEPKYVRWVIWAFISGTTLTAIAGLAGGASAEVVTAYGGTTRLSGNIDDPNFLAALIVPALVLVAFVAVTESNPFVRWLLASYAAILLVALFLTQSRGGLIGLGAAAVASLFLSGKLRPKAVAAVLSVGAVSVVYYTLVAPPAMLARVMGFSSGGGTGRLDLWHIAVEMYKNHPLLGVGVGNFQVLEPRYASSGFNLTRVDLVLDHPRVVHNTYLHVLVELGIVGLVIFSLIVLATLISAMRCAKLLSLAGDWRSELYARGLVIAMIGTLASDFFLTAQYDKRLWLLLGVTAAFSSLVAAARERAPAPD